MAPSIAARRLDGVRSVPAGAAPEMAAALETRARPLDGGTFPPDEEYGRDRRTRCAAEIRSATYILAQTM